LPLKLAFEEIALETAPRALTELRFIPGTNEFLLMEKPGTVLHYRLEGNTALHLGGFVLAGVDDYHDCGLISLAFDPDFASNGYVYFGYCMNRDFSVISRHVFDAADYGSIEATAAEVIRVGMDDAPNAWHNIGSIGFDAEGYLWALFGEKNDGPQAQDRTNNLGAVIRIDPRKGPDESGYQAVPSNPFAMVTQDGGVSPDIVAHGLRSPWRGHLDSRGALWIGDVGGQREEVNRLPRFDGSNFGWPVQDATCTAPECSTFREPLITWTRAANHPFLLEDPDTAPTTRRVVWVGLEYRSTASDPYEGRFTGRLVYGDFCAGWVRAAGVDAEGRLVYDAFAGHLDGVTSWDQAADGFAYVATYGNCHATPYRPGKVFRAVLGD
jgi:glucose/arabinose dehydrogenase